MGAHRLAPGAARRGQAAARLHDGQGQLRPQTRFEVGQVGVHDRGHVGIGHGGGGALEFAEFGQDFVGEGNREPGLGQGPAQQIARARARRKEKSRHTATLVAPDPATRAANSRAASSGSASTRPPSAETRPMAPKRRDSGTRQGGLALVRS